jgi:hypothetical protein
MLDSLHCHYSLRCSAGEPGFGKRGKTGGRCDLSASAAGPPASGVKPIEANGSCGLQQPHIAADKGNACSLSIAPLQSCSKLHRISRLQGEAINKFLSALAQPLAGEHFKPDILEVLQLQLGSDEITDIQLPHAHQPRKCASHLYWSSPPNCNFVSVAERESRRRGCLPYAQGDERARIPESPVHLSITPAVDRGLDGKVMRNAAPPASMEGRPIHFGNRQLDLSSGGESGLAIAPVSGVEWQDPRDRNIAVADDDLFAIADVFEIGAELIPQSSDVGGAHPARLRRLG